MAGELAVWLYGSQVALIDQQRPGQPRLIYTSEALKSYESGTPLLSLTLPVRTERYPQGVVKAFLDGILPEGDTRRAIADELDLRANDTFGLMKALGRDCAGAIVVQPVDDPAPPPATTATARPLSEDELADLIGNLRNAPLGVGGRVRVSLAGVQEKLLLTRLADGQWGSPVDGTPSTHILKPEIRGLRKTVENEAFCMRLARNLGLPVADIETMEIQNRRLIVVTRYDRRIDARGHVERIHQEDFCQASGRPPVKKYQEDGGPTLRDIARVLSATDPGSLSSLLRAVTLHVLVGNGDAHAKNYSLLHEPSGALRLAPLYDVMSTLFYGDDRLAMYVDDIRRTNRVTTDRLLNEASSWGLARRTAAEIVDELLTALPGAVDRAASQTPGLPDEIPAIVTSQFDQLRRA
jgi:serine/threonine-protein kinase HipA